MHIRAFGKQIDNLRESTKDHHIVLKSKSFSNQNYSQKEQGKQPIEKKTNKRSTFIEGLIKNKHKTSNSSNNTTLPNQNSALIKDVQSENLLNKLQNLPKDPQLTKQYMFDNIKAMKQSEKTNFKIKLKNKQKIEKLSKKRQKIIDWLAAIHYQLQLFPQTLYIAVSYMDIYIAKKQVQEHELDKIAITCLLLAGKYQETYRIPYIRNLLDITNIDLTFTQIKSLQEKIIQALQFKFIEESSIKYLNLYAKLTGLSLKNHSIASYILQISLLEPAFLKFTPSMLGASVIYLVNKIRKISAVWPLYLQELTELKQSQLRECAKLLCTLLEKPQSLGKGQKIRKKYSTKQFHQASKIKLQRKTG